MNDPDSDLHELFTGLRGEDQKAAPSFQRLMQRARNKAVPRRRHLGWALATSAAAVALLSFFALMPASKPKPSLAHMLPVLLTPAASPEAPLLARLTEPSNASGSDFLLPLHLAISPL